VIKSNHISRYTRPLITVITVVFNAADTIRETIESVIKQTYNNIEYIIIDGGSIDSTIDIIREYEENINYWTTSKDQGIFDAMNKAIEIAHGDWINFLNAGDVYIDEETLAYIIKKLKDKKFMYGFSYIEKIKIGHTYYKRKRLPTNIVYNMPTCHNAFFFPNNRIIKYNLKYQIASDYAYFREYLSLGYKFQFELLPAVIWQRGGFSDKNIIKNISDRVLINFKYGFKSNFIDFIIFYTKELCGQILKKLVPMRYLNAIRSIYKFNYHIFKDND